MIDYNVEELPSFRGFNNSVKSLQSSSKKRKRDKANEAKEAEDLKNLILNKHKHHGAVSLPQSKHQQSLDAIADQLAKKYGGSKGKKKKN